MRYEVTHPNGFIHIVEAENDDEARQMIVDRLHEEIKCDPSELMVEEAIVEEADETAGLEEV